MTKDMHGKAKPSPEPFLLGMKMLGVTAKETMLVWDSIRRDIVPAKALGMLAVHAVYGDRNFHEAEKRGIDIRVLGGEGDTGAWGDFTLSTVAKKPKNAFVGLLLNLQKRLLPGSPLDDPDVIDKEIFLIPFFTGDFFENF